MHSNPIQGVHSAQPMHRTLNAHRSNTNDTYLYLPKPSPSICPHAYPNKRRRTSIRWRYSMRRVFCALHSFNKSSSSSIASNETSSPPKLRSRRASMPDAWWNPKFLDGQTNIGGYRRTTGDVNMTRALFEQIARMVWDSNSPPEHQEREKGVFDSAGECKGAESGTTVRESNSCCHP